jgi:mannose-1-phosphate guanylyltransferase
MTDLSRWPALVLTAGLATRLRPLSTVRAKAAVPVAGDALVCRILRWLRRSGVNRVVLNLHHRADSITRIVGDGSPLGLDVRYSWESPLLGSAGGPARAVPLLEADRFLIVNGDTLADVDLRALATHHLDTNALVTMAVVKGDPRYNGVISAHGIALGFGPPPLAGQPIASYGEISSGRPSAAKAGAGADHFIGIQAVNASAFSGVSPDTPSETVKALYPSLIERHPQSVRVFRTGAEFFDIGTPADYLDTVATLAERENKPIDRGRHCAVAADAQLDRTILWDNVTIEPGVALSNCIVTDGVRVPSGARHDRCSIVMTERGMIAEPWNPA